MINHIVFLKLKDNSSDSVAKTKRILLSMEGKIEQLRYLEVGEDFLHSERSYDLALITKFDSKEDLAAYQVHPYHVNEVVAHMKEAAQSSITVDYEK